jgi:type VI secretion system secreted protein VgrG
VADNFTQTNRPLSVITPLASDTLLLVGFSGHEGISELFHFHLELVAETKKLDQIAFDKLLGQPITVNLRLGDGKTSRHISAICSRFTQGESDEDFSEFRMELVPRFWLWTKRAQSRIFQHETVPDILKKVLKGLEVDYSGIQGTFEKRDYCVQYRETDFNFASRLMEEEGIYYYFAHSEKGHKMFLANTPQGHPALPNGDQITYKHLSQAAAHDHDFIYDWGKTQEVTSGKYTLWDHSFELPHKHLESEKIIQDSVQTGEVPHKLKVANNTDLEIYDWPGEYAQRFDGIDRGGSEQPPELQKIFQDNARTVGIRMQQEAVTGVLIQGASNCRHVVPGYRFTLTMLQGDSLAGAKAKGAYVLTGVSHTARVGSNYRSGDWGTADYHNSFTCIPAALPYRPTRKTPKPIVPGSQTAVVVGPPGEEIFCDKYGRVKVQFHWDRAGKNNADSSCWIRVGTLWAGKHWGVIHIPRIGQEVIVDFLEGDADQPIIVGSVFNAEQMPAYKLPDEKTKSYVKTNTSPGGKGFNEIRIEDKKDKEQIFIHAQKNMDVRVRHDSMERVIHDRHLIVGYSKDEQDEDGNTITKKGGDQREQVFQDKHLNIKRHHVEQIEGNMQLTVGKGEAEEGGNVDILIEKDKKETIEGNMMLHILKTLAAQVDGSVAIILNNNVTTLVKGNSHQEVKGERREKVGGGQSLTVQGDQVQKITGVNHVHVTADQNEKVDGTHSETIGQNLQQKVGMNHGLEAGQEVHIKAGMKVIIEAGAQLSLKGPGGFVNIGPSGVDIQGTLVNINSGGSAGSGSGVKAQAPQEPKVPDDPSKDAPKDAQQAKPVVPTQADNAATGQKSAPS